MSFFKKKHKKKGRISLENLQNLSKLKKICVHNFFEWLHALFFLKKKLCTHIFLSLERVWREFGDSPNFPLFFKKMKKISSKDFFEFGASLG